MVPRLFPSNQGQQEYDSIGQLTRVLRKEVIQWVRKLFEVIRQGGKTQTQSRAHTVCELDQIVTTTSKGNLRYVDISVITARYPATSEKRRWCWWGPGWGKSREGCKHILSILDGLGDLVRFRDGCQAPAKEEHEGQHQSPNDLLWHTAATLLVLCVYVHDVCTEYIFLHTIRIYYAYIIFVYVMRYRGGCFQFLVQRSPKHRDYYRTIKWKLEIQNPKSIVNPNLEKYEIPITNQIIVRKKKIIH